MTAVNSGEPTDVDPIYAHGKARVPGRGRGDKVKALLEPGEAVLTRHAAERLGRGRIAELNKSSRRLAGPPERPGRRSDAHPGDASMSGLEIAMHAHADREHPRSVPGGAMR